MKKNIFGVEWGREEKERNEKVKKKAERTMALLTLPSDSSEEHQFCWSLVNIKGLMPLTGNVRSHPNDR